MFINSKKDPVLGQVSWISSSVVLVTWLESTILQGLARLQAFVNSTVLLSKTNNFQERRLASAEVWKIFRIFWSVKAGWSAEATFWGVDSRQWEDWIHIWHSCSRPNKIPSSMAQYGMLALEYDPSWHSMVCYCSLEYDPSWHSMVCSQEYDPS